ncbi:cytochrome P450 [Fennellomyces sp. T-0311]|nr:cytochrome P450 [Fennellomyces sp. T-0311]
MNYATLTQTLGASAANLLERIKGIDRVDIEKAGKVATVAIVGCFVTSKLYNAFFSPLSHIPGPFQLRFYDMRYAPNFESPPGTSWKKTKQWRDKYGDIVRVGPNMVMVSNKRVLRQIGADDVPKGPAYVKLQKNRGGVSLTSATDKVFHKQRRRIMSAAFSAKNLNLLEPAVLSAISTFTRCIDSTIEKNRDKNGYAEIDIWNLLERLGIEVIGHMAFSTEFKAIETEDHPIHRAIQKESKALEFAVAHPILIDFIFAVPLLTRLLISKTNDMTKYLRNIVEQRVTGAKKASRTDFLQTMIDTHNPECKHDQISVDDMITECVSLIMAGAGTTSRSNGFAIIHLLQHPEVLCQLQKEIDGVQMEPGKMLLSDQQLKKLPYLNAFINESLRLNGSGAIGAERIADKDMLLDGRVFVPKGTLLHVNLYHTETDPAYWPEPESLIPERWMEGSSIPADQEAYLPFSIGARNCIGKHVALQEMRLAIGNLVKLYSFKTIPEQMELAEDRRAFRALELHGNSFKVSMKRRRSE